MPALLPRFTGLGGGRGGCFGCGVTLPDEAAEDEGGGRVPEDCMLAPADDTALRGLPLPAAEEEEEEKAAGGLWTGVRGDPSAPGSGVEVISHFGGITDCFGGRGSRKVSRMASGSGTKWLSDSGTHNEKRKA